MDSFASARRTRIAGWVAATIIVSLNVILLGEIAFSS
jgi:manganese transport protein